MARAEPLFSHLNSLTPEDEKTVATHSVLYIILDEIERVIPSAFATGEALHGFLTATGHAAHVPPPTSGHVDEHWARMHSEARQAFCVFVSTLSSQNLRAVAPLPYRRVLGDQEAERLWKRLWHEHPYMGWENRPLPPLDMIQRALRSR